jgi:hypothetical protein
MKIFYSNLKNALNISAIYLMFVENCCLFCKPQVCSGLKVLNYNGDINAVKCTLIGLNNGLKTLKWGYTELRLCKLDVKQSKNLNQEISHKEFAVVATIYLPSDNSTSR